MRTVFRTARTIAVASVLATGFTLPLAAAAQSTLDITVHASACVNCHIAEGNSPGGIPTIAGRPEAVLLEKLIAFRSDSLPANTTIMNRLVKGFSDDEIKALAHHFSQITAQPLSSKQGLKK